MSSREFVEWMAYFQIEPFGQDVDHAMIAQQTALVANVNRDRKKKSSPFETEDFMPGTRVKQVDQIDLKARTDVAMAALAAMANKKPTKRKEVGDGA